MPSDLGLPLRRFTPPLLAESALGSFSAALFLERGQVLPLYSVQPSVSSGRGGGGVGEAEGDGAGEREESLAAEGEVVSPGATDEGASELGKDCKGKGRGKGVRNTVSIEPRHDGGYAPKW